jgi:hypothetical protein
MDNVTLKKKLSTYESDKGYLKNVSDDILYEVLVAWENWTGPSADFYRSLGFTHSQMAGIIGKAKKLKRDGHFGSAEFKQVKVDVAPDAQTFASNGASAAVEVVWKNGQLIRFANVDMLLDFLKRSAA